MLSMTSSSQTTPYAEQAEQLEQELSGQPVDPAEAELRELYAAVLKHRAGRDFLRRALVREFVAYEGSDPLAMARAHEHNTFAHQLLGEFELLCPELYQRYLVEGVEMRTNQQGDK